VKRSGQLLLLCWSLAATLPSGCQPPPAAVAPPPPKVTVTVPVQQDVVDSLYYSGKTQATEYVEIRARVTGELIKKYIPKKAADGGETWFVEENELLFEIEHDPFEADLAAAQARRKQTQAAVALAKAKLERAKRLVTTKAITAEEYQTRAAEYQSAMAKLDSDQAEIEQATISRDYTWIRAPIGGRASRHLVDVGNLVSGTEKTLLATIAKLDEMYVYFDVDEKAVLSLLRWRREHADEKVDPKVYLALADEEGFSHEGVIDYFDNRVDPGTGTAIARGKFRNDKGLFYPGLFVRVRIPTETQKDALLVSDRAISTDLGGKYVLLVDEKNIVEQRYVELGTLDGGMRMVRKGIGPEDRYVINGMQRARPGLPVDPQMVAPPAAPATTSGGDEPPPSPRPPAESDGT